ADVWDAEGDLTALRAPFLPQESATALARFETAPAGRPVLLARALAIRLAAEAARAAASAQAGPHG
ncbi:hypothetical protein ABZ114_03150, partial [Streptomyces albidoflavus]